MVDVLAVDTGKTPAKAASSRVVFHRTMDLSVIDASE